jgi:hypothetical protein
VVAVDDVPWLDKSSQEALAFAARRLRGHAIRFLLTRRPGEATPLERAFGPAAVDQLEIGTLSLGAVRSLLATRLDLRPPRRVLLRLLELSHGTPLVALELGRMLVDRGLPDLGQELPLPELVDEVFGRRIAGLPEPVRRALLAVALSGGLSRLEISSLVGPLTLEDATAEGVLELDRNRVRASHPLLAAAARRLSSEEERRELHLGLAAAIDDEILQARHLALAASRPEAALARRVVAAADKAMRRGGVHDAVELAEQALRLTPAGSAAHEERVLTLVRYLNIAGEADRVGELLEARLADLEPGRERARVLLMLSENGERLSQMEAYVDGALAECGGDAELRSAALAKKALIHAIVRFDRLEEAEEWAAESLRLAESVGAGAQQHALHALAWVNVMRGRPLDEAVGPCSRRPRRMRASMRVRWSGPPGSASWCAETSTRAGTSSSGCARSPRKEARRCRRASCIGSCARSRSAPATCALRSGISRSGASGRFPTTRTSRWSVRPAAVPYWQRCVGIRTMLPPGRRRRSQRHRRSRTTGRRPRRSAPADSQPCSRESMSVRSSTCGPCGNTPAVRVSTTRASCRSRPTSSRRWSGWGRPRKRG